MGRRVVKGEDDNWSEVIKKKRSLHKIVQMVPSDYPKTKLEFISSTITESESKEDSLDLEVLSSPKLKQYSLLDYMNSSRKKSSKGSPTPLLTSGTKKRTKRNPFS